MSIATYYVLKVKGKAKIPDYIQVRDASFTLIGYFRPQRGEIKKNLRTSEKTDALSEIFEKIEKVVPDIPFGVITKVELIE